MSDKLLGVSIGFKTSKGLVTSRTEINVSTREVSQTFTANAGSHVELVGVGVGTDIGFFARPAFEDLYGTGKTVGLKVDLFSHGSYGILVGGGYTPLDKHAELRIGIGTNKKNVYLQVDGKPYQLLDQFGGAIKISEEFFDRLVLDPLSNAPIHSLDDWMRGLGFDDGCFLGSTMVSMWPLDVRPHANGRYDQNEVRAKTWDKPIRDITVEDWVVSYDKDGLLIPGRVTRTMINNSKHILDVFGLMVTPGHVTLCGDGKFAGQHVPILDILRSDGSLVKKDGSKVRAATNFPVGSPEDQLIWAVTGEPTRRGVAKPIDHGQIRLGTCFMAPDEHGKMQHYCIADIIRDMDLEVTEDGLLRRKEGDQTPAPFHWVWSMSLPNPEDYVLSRSDLTLEDIYRANEWEAVKPKMPTPPNVKGSAIASQPMMHAGTAAVSAGVSAPNVLMSMRSAPEQPTLSRKQRRAQEKKMGQAAKTNLTKDQILVH